MNARIPLPCEGPLVEAACCAAVDAARASRSGSGRTPYGRLFGRQHVWLAWAILLIAIIHPAHGLGTRVCLFQASTGLSCPGCGLIRSVSCTVRGDLAAAWDYHPFGPILVGLCALIGVVGILPRRVRKRLATFMSHHARGFNLGCAALVVAFLGYGVARALWQGLIRLAA